VRTLLRRLAYIAAVYLTDKYLGPIEQAELAVRAYPVLIESKPGS